MLPPGPRFLLTIPPSGSFYLLCTGCLYYGLQSQLGDNVRIPLYLRPGVLLALFSLVVSGKLALNRLRLRLDARAHGAVLPPTVKGSWPGNIDIVCDAMEEDRTGYLNSVQILGFIKEYGWTFNWKMLWEDKFVTVDPEIIKIMLATDFNSFEKAKLFSGLTVKPTGSEFKSDMQSVLGDGVFNSDGELWKFHRSMTRPFFTKDRISHFEIFGRHADSAIALLKERTREGHAVDIQDLLARFTLDSATEFLLGQCVNVLRTGLPYSPNLATSTNERNSKPSDVASRFSTALGSAQVNLAKRLQVGYIWPLLDFWKDTTLEDMDIVKPFIDSVLEEGIVKGETSDTFTAGKKEIGESETLLDHLITYTKDVKVLRDEIINILIAGRDTTACLLTFAMYCLAMHPEVLKRLREEILAVVGNERNPTYDDVKEVKYLRAVLNETLRLYPPVPFNERATIKPTALPNRALGAKPWYIPSRTRVIYSVFFMHRRTDLWGPDAEEFDPDRFLDERLHKYLTPNPFIFLPFNAGPRICLGQQFAYNEASFMLIRLLQAFDGIELAPDAQPTGTLPPAEWARAVGERKSKERVWPKVHLTLYAHGGVWVRLHEATDTELA